MHRAKRCGLEKRQVFFPNGWPKQATHFLPDKSFSAYRPNGLPVFKHGQSLNTGNHALIQPIWVRIVRLSPRVVLPMINVF